MVKQCRFLNAKKSVTFGLADAREKEQAVTHPFKVKAFAFIPIPTNSQQ